MKKIQKILLLGLVIVVMVFSFSANKGEAAPFLGEGLWRRVGNDYVRYSPYNNYTSYNNSGYISIQTKSASAVGRDVATLRGTVSLNNSDYAYVWFEYGTGSNSLNKKTARVRINDDDDNVSFTKKITSLDRSRRYYFRAVGRDESGRETRGTILNFTTGNSNSNNGDDPQLDTQSATSITKNSAKIRGSVDMNDFENGKVFFVYGEDESQVEDAADDYDTYSSIDEDGDNLQKVQVDADLDDDESYTVLINGLDDDTDYFYNICVEYENDDDDNELACGDVEDFTTDN